MMRFLGMLALLLSLAGCGGSKPGYAWFGERTARPMSADASPIRIRWNQRLTTWFEGPYIPVERAVAALDPGRDRIYVGSTRGVVYAFDSVGRRFYRYDAQAAIEGEPAIDRQHNELYVGSEDGVLHALDAGVGKLRWRVNAGGPIRRVPILTDDAVYVVTDFDEVLAFARRDGEQLWSYRRESPEGFSIARHAGLLLENGTLVTGFSDGVAVALDALDGRVVWERDTSEDLDEADLAPRFIDVDTTPVLVDGVVLVASFEAGLYALSPTSGGVEWRKPELKGVFSIAVSPQCLLLASAEDGIVCLDRIDHETVLWRRRMLRGAPSTPVVVGDVILVGESRGGFLALGIDDGEELGRIELGNGFSAPPAYAGGYGFVVSNGGSLVAFRL